MATTAEPISLIMAAYEYSVTSCVKWAGKLNKVPRLPATCV